MFLPGGTKEQLSITTSNIVCLLMNSVRVVAKTLVQLYIYGEVCKQLYPYSGDKCTQPEQQSSVTDVAANYIFMEKILLNLPAFFLLPFFGRWTDTEGRKLPALLALFGNLLGVLLYTTASSNISIYALGILLAGSAIRGLSGKSGFIVTSLQCYIIDVCKSESVSKGLGNFMACNLWGYAGGLLLTGLFLQITSYAVLFSVLICVIAFCIFIVLICMLDIKPINETASSVDNGSYQNPETRVEEKESLCSNMTFPIQVVALQRPHNYRLQLQLLLILTVLYHTCRVGEEDILLLFIQRASFSSTRSSYAYLMATSFVLQGFFLIAILPIYLNIFHIHPYTMMAIGFISKIIGLSIYTYSTQSWHLYIGIFISTPNVIFLKVAQMALKEIVKQQELATVIGLSSAFETISSILGSAVFVYTYAYTSQLYAGTVFVVMIIVFTIMFVITILLWKLHLRTGRNKK